MPFKATYESELIHNGKRLSEKKQNEIANRCTFNTLLTKNFKHVETTKQLTEDKLIINVYYDKIQSNNRNMEN